MTSRLSLSAPRRPLLLAVILACLPPLSACGTMRLPSACPQPSAPGSLMLPPPPPVLLQSAPHSPTSPTMPRSATA